MDLLSFVLQAEQIDTIMHFAAQVRVWQGSGLKG
jgi:UDP-glucose 4-epimerase